MLMNAPHDYSCRGCGSTILAGERISWVVPGHPYHTSCSPNSEDVELARQEHENEAAFTLNAAAATSKMSSDYAALITATLIAESLIIGAIALRNSPGYYVLLRLVVCAVSGFLAFRLFRSKRAIFSVLVGFAAVVYNPILQVRLPHETWQLINVLTLAMLAAALYVLRPKKLTSHPDSSPALNPCRACEHCGQERVTLNAQFYENVSYFYGRRQRSVDANLCFSCTAKVYRTFTFRTLAGTWWGLIGMCLGPVIIVFNTLWFVSMSIGFLWLARRATTEP
jgi:hypothetical protein